MMKNESQSRHLHNIHDIQSSCHEKTSSGLQKDEDK
jgi:hypothetical protein